MSNTRQAHSKKPQPFLLDDNRRRWVSGVQRPLAARWPSNVVQSSSHNKRGARATENIKYHKGNNLAWRNTSPEATLAIFRRQLPIVKTCFLNVQIIVCSTTTRAIQFSYCMFKSWTLTLGHQKITTPTPLHVSYLHTHRPQCCVNNQIITVWSAGMCKTGDQKTIAE